MQSVLGWARGTAFVSSLTLLGIACQTPPLKAADQAIIGAYLDEKANHAYPVCSAVIDVTKPPYNAKGDGTGDDTDAIQRALLDVMGQHKILYFPNGTYLISKPILWSKKNSQGQDAWRFSISG